MTTFFTFCIIIIFILILFCLIYLMTYERRNYITIKEQVDRLESQLVEYPKKKGGDKIS